MILPLLLVIPLVFGLLAWGLAAYDHRLARWTAVCSMLLDLALVVTIWVKSSLSTTGVWLEEINLSWMPHINARFHVAVDGISLTLLALTFFLGILSVACSWRGITERVGFFHFNLLWSFAGIAGVFIAIDLFLFYFVWELMLIPIYFLIALWGHEQRRYAATKFFLFTQIGGLFMLAAILALYWIHGYQTGHYTFDYQELIDTTLHPSTAMWLMLGFASAFFVKLPVIPFHTWLPDAHTQAPTAGSVILAGLLLKTGAYGLIRFVIPLFPEAASSFAPIAWILGIAGILYGAALAFAQTDVKRLIAYTSISHMGFALIGIFSNSSLGLQGAVITLLAHGVSTGALFIMAGDLQDRLHTRDLAKMGGLWTDIPTMGAIALFFAIATLGLPGFGNFIGEFLVLLGVYHINIIAAVLAAFGLVLAVVYAVWMMQRVFYGKSFTRERIPDLSLREMGIFSCLMIAILWIGLYPAPFFQVLTPAIERIVND